MEKEKLVLIGNGMAGVRCMEHLLKLAPNKYEITIFGSEPHPNYNRILLSSVLAGDAGMEEIVINDWAWYEQHQIKLHAGHTVSSIDVEAKRVTSDKGVTAEFDKLVIATGSKPFILPIPGSDKYGVIAFRDIQDCKAMMEASKTYKKAVVIGGGLLGLEAARGLLNLNMRVSVVHIYRHLMERQLDETAARMLQADLERQGMTFLMERHTEAILGKERVTGLKFKDGSVEPADLVVMAVGIRPNVDLAKNCGIEVNRGIVVNDYMETSIPGIYSLGECAEHNGVAYGLVAPLYEQGEVLAKRLAAAETRGYQGSVVSTKLKVSGVDVFSAGRFEDRPGVRSLRMQDDFSGIYKKVLIEGSKVVGAVLVGDTTDSAKLFNFIRKEEDVSGQERSLLFPDGGSKGGGLDAASMASDEIVCGCNGVSKGAIMTAIAEKGCQSVGDVKACTKASASCGGCKPIVESLLHDALGDGVKEAKEGICGCTTRSRDEIVDAIREMHLTNTREVMNVLGWSSPEGCSKCRPSLNYYIGMVWPEEHRDETESRFVNERNHANIQKDGTFSVVPRIYGGVTTPEELEKIAKIAAKYQVPMVKFTGGQRLDLLGVKKEDLPRMWEELDMPSGYAYGKALRTVKTCVGNTFCRFGTQDSIGMGIELEKRFERLQTPAKVKLAVSGCPRNCAEATIKDFGVVAIDGGWELHIGGNGGVNVRATDLLGKVKTEAEVMEWAGAFLQYYRENAKWNERTSEWVNRIGLDAIKEALNSKEARIALNDRIDKTLSLTTDPWKEILSKEELRKTYEPLSVANVGAAEGGPEHE